MIQICRNDKDRVTSNLQNGAIDSTAVSETNLVDTIIMCMHKEGILGKVAEGFRDNRTKKEIQFSIIMALAIAAKMKVKTSLSDIPYAITDN